MRRSGFTFLCAFAWCQLTPNVSTAQETLKYVEFTTAGAAGKSRLPLIVAIHGLGDTPENFSTFLKRFPAPTRVIALRAPQAYHQGFSWFPIRASALMTDPNLKRGVALAAKQVAATVRALVKERPTNGLPLVVGFSQGGILSFFLASHFPSEFKAAFPIAGMLPGPPQSPPKVKTKIYAFHGAADRVIPITGSERAIETLKSLGYATQLTRYPGVGHHFSRRLVHDLFEAMTLELPPSL